MPKGHIYLIGFMGAGKSTIAWNLARITRCRLVDTDREIVEREGRSISEIFKEEGEPYFRRVETDTMRRIADLAGGDGENGPREELVVSCGGGVVMNPENVALMKDSGTVVLLDSTPEVILERVSRNNRRPVLEGRKNIESIREMMAERMPAYRRAADLRVRSDNDTPERIARRIIRLTNA